MNETHNPYAPPRAFVDDPSDDELEVQALIENGRTVPIGRCGLWISASFRQFFQRPWKWIGTLFLLFVRALPVISIAEMRELILHHGHGASFAEHGTTEHPQQA